MNETGWSGFTLPCYLDFLLEIFYRPRLILFVAVVVLKK